MSVASALYHHSPPNEILLLKLTKKIYVTNFYAILRNSLLFFAFFCSITLILNLSQFDQWRRQRSASNPIVARPATVAHYLPMHNKIVNEFISLFLLKLDNGENHIIEDNFQISLKLLHLLINTFIRYESTSR